MLLWGPLKRQQRQKQVTTFQSDKNLVKEMTKKQRFFVVSYAIIENVI